MSFSDEYMEQMERDYRRAQIKKWFWNIIGLTLIIVGGGIIFIVLMGGGNYLWCHLTGHPYYTDLGEYSGHYCIDKVGIAWGEPPGYVYNYTIQTPLWYDENDPGAHLPHYMKLEKYNDSAWVPFSQWPPCTVYGEP